ncbi:hypothetical protein, partial [Rathayibacter rathayi]
TSHGNRTSRAFLSVIAVILPIPRWTRKNGAPHIDSQERDVKVGIGGTTKAKELLSLGKAAMELRDKSHTNHRDLDFFNSWQEVVDFANEDDGGEIAALVKVIDDYGPERIIEAVKATVPVEQARTVVSTMHVAKGLEFFHVKIGPDFYEPGKDDDGQQKPLTRPEARLLYVGVTRAAPPRPPPHRLGEDVRGRHHRLTNSRPHPTSPNPRQHRAPGPPSTRAGHT